MLLFETEERTEKLQARALSGTAAADPDDMIELAWYIRQRDPKRAEDILTQAETSPLSAGLEGRVALMRAEQQWLAGNVDASYATAQKGFDHFSSFGDLTGCADTKLLQAFIAKSTSRVGELDKLLSDAADYANQAGDLDRSIFIRCAQIREEVFRNPADCQSELISRIEPLESRLHLATTAQVIFTKGVVTFRTGNTADCIPLFASAMAKMQATGQILHAIICASNISAIYNLLHDNEGGLEWAQRALDSSRTAGWPLQLGIALVRVAECVRPAGRAELGLELLDEAHSLNNQMFI